MGGLAVNRDRETDETATADHNPIGTRISDQDAIGPLVGHVFFKEQMAATFSRIEAQRPPNACRWGVSLEVIESEGRMSNGNVLRVVSWNVEHFRDGDPARITRVFQLLNQQQPDVFALYEVEGSEVFGAVTTQMPGYSAQITEGPQTQEILVGWRSTLDAFMTQRTEFRSGVSALRPGALITVTIDGTPWPILFLHTKSKDDPRGFGLRDDQFTRAFKLLRALNKSAVALGFQRANFVFAGDLNTMGMDYTFSDSDIAAPQEIEHLTKAAAHSSRQMRVLEKNSPATWTSAGGSLPDSDLDHVVAADHLTFTQFNGKPVDARGWPQLSPPQRADWVRDYSDHALLCCEIQLASASP